MGIFGDDKLQDERISALEEHVRMLTETLHATQADLAEGRIAILALQAQIDDKVSSADVDPAIAEFNKKLAQARTQLAKSSAVASESWATLQDGVRESFESMRKSVHQAYDQIKKD